MFGYTGRPVKNRLLGKMDRACMECHRADGLLDFQALGYDSARIAELTTLEFSE